MQSAILARARPRMTQHLSSRYGIVIANKLVNNLSIISVQSEHDHDKIYYTYRNKHKQVVQCYTSKNTFLYTSVAVPCSVARELYVVH